MLNRSLMAHARALEKKEYSSLELTRAYLKQIEAKDPEVGAYLFVCAEEAEASAKESDLRRAKGATLGILDGIPYGAKDNLSTRGIPTTCGSLYLQNYIPPYSATVIRRLDEAGAVLLGKLNMDEFGMGSTTEHSAFHPTKNPVDPLRSPGGSSGGSAAALRAHMAVFTLGSDTGGSVRQPASHCGVVGMKPTYGSVSRYGLCAFASSLEQIGPLTATVEENELLLSYLQGRDPHDATTRSPSAPQDVPEISKLRVAIPSQLMGNEISVSVRNTVLDAAEQLRRAGAKVEEISLPSLAYATAAYYILSAAEASSNLARMDGVRFGAQAKDPRDLSELYRRSRSEGFGTEVKRRILLGTFVLSEGYREHYYEHAVRAKNLFCEELAHSFEDYDLLLSPVAPTTAPLLSQSVPDPTQVYRQDLCTVPANLGGIPALSLPFGQSEEGLPIGVQLMGPRHSEALLYRVGRELELCRKASGGVK